MRLDVAWLNLGTLGLFPLSLVFMVWEYLRPGWSVDRLKDLHLDLIGATVGFGCAVIAHAIATTMARLVGANAMAVPDGVSSILRVLGTVVAVDFSIYWIHRAMHIHPLLWRMHRWHHSIENLYWFSGFRASFLHLLCYAVPEVLWANYIFALNPTELGVVILIGHFVQLWTHSNARIDIKWLELYVITSASHRIHHARDAAAPVNLGNLLTLWDRVFGTYETPKLIQQEYPLGLLTARPTLMRMLIGI